MRPAPRIEPVPDEDAPRPDEVEPSRVTRSRAARSKRRLVVGLLVVVIALAGAGAGAWALISSSNPSPGASGSPASSPARPPFFFRISDVKADTTGPKATGAAGDASVEIAGRLSYFYDTVFMNPDTWRQGVPDKVWLLFDSSVRDRAQTDGASFTLGPEAARLKSLRVENTSLSVEVLVDPHGNAQAAVANVEFKARGSLLTGQEATVTSTASLLLQLEGGEWVVFGYPTAKTTFEAQALSPSAGQIGASASPGAGTTTP